jgi:dTMP kinase
MATTGKLIVIDGADGAGKATQTKLLVERLRSEGVVVETMSFPNYDHNVFGKLIKDCLQGKRGDFASLDARIASTLYAADRFESRPQLMEWLAAGKMVILDRYVSSNMLHQGSKIVNDEAALKDFLTWNDHVEHVVFGLPRPNLIVYLDVPYLVRKNLMHHDGVRAGLDTVETDEGYQRAAEVCAQELLASLNTWHRVSCVENDVLRTREAIHEDVYAVVRDQLA